MGQVERYGVFALCVVIFLILGIAIWGGGTPAPAVAGGGKEAVAAPKAAGKDANSPLLSETEQREAIEGNRKDGKPVSTFPRSDVEIVDGPTLRPEPPSTEARTYRIKGGDTLAKIAARELGDKRKVDAILAANPGLDARKLHENQEIKLPATTVRSEPRSDGKTPVRAVAPGAHPEAVAKGGGKAPEAGKKHGDKATPAVAKAKDAVKPGAKASAPGAKDQPTDKVAAWPKHYKVAAGDRLASIARRFYGDDRKFAALAKANGIKDASHLREGMMLTIPAVN